MSRWAFLGCLFWLQEPNAPKDEVNKLRLTIQGTLRYIHLKEDYLLRMLCIESDTKSKWKNL